MTGPWCSYGRRDGGGAWGGGETMEEPAEGRRLVGSTRFYLQETKMSWTDAGMDESTERCQCGSQSSRSSDPKIVTSRAAGRSRVFFFLKN